MVGLILAYLSPEHRKMLEQDSGLSPAIIESRGYWTARTKAEIKKLGFAASQQFAPALVVPSRDVYESGFCSYQIRPDSPRLDKKGKPIKYESLKGGHFRLDIHPEGRALLDDITNPLFVTEGIKKGDAATLRGLCCIALPGVTMWKTPDWNTVPLKGRKVYIVFDSDAAENSAVFHQMRELGKFLTSRGAIVRYISIPSKDGRKVGLDDFFMLGGTTSQLLTFAAEELPRAPRAKGDIDRKDYPRTDSGNAERLVDKYGQDLHYCADINKWFIWSGTRWEMDTSKTGAVTRLAKAIAREMAKEFEDIPDDDERESALKFAKQSENYRPIKDCIELVKSHSSIACDFEAFDLNNDLLNVANGTLDLCTFEMHDHAREDMLTRLIDIPYEANAECPRWEAFLNVILENNDALLRYIWKACGYTLTSDVSEKCFFFLYGHKGDNGKSTFVEALMAVLGPYAKATPLSTLLVKKQDGGIPNDIARLKGIRLVSAPEAGENKRLDEEVIKQLTGNDTIPARFLNAEFFDFKPQFKLWMTGNYKPVITGQDRAIWNRVKLIPFTYSVPEADQDKSLPQKLFDERVGILSWMIDGCMAWRRERLSAPAEIRDAVEAYRKEMDNLGEFLEQCTEECPASTLMALTLYSAYEKWCKVNGIARPMTSTMFGRKLTDRGIEKLHTRTGNDYVGLRLKETDDTSHVYRGGD